MTTYFQWAEQKTKPPPAVTEHGTEKGLWPDSRSDIVEIPSIMVTEDRAGNAAADAYRHDWSMCPCAKCRSDRREE